MMYCKRYLEIYPVLEIDSFSVYNLSYKEIQIVLLQIVKPKNKFSFIAMLTKEAKFIIADNYKPTTANYKILHDAILEYTRNFRNIYEFIAEYNVDANFSFSSWQGGSAFNR